MIELVMVVCLAAAPQDCEERSLLFQDVSTMACMTQAQPQMARWIGEHPRWRVSEWKCRSARLGARDA